MSAAASAGIARPSARAAAAAAQAAEPGAARLAREQAADVDGGVVVARLQEPAIDECGHAPGAEIRRRDHHQRPFQAGGHAIRVEREDEKQQVRGTHVLEEGRPGNERAAPDLDAGRGSWMPTAMSW